MRNEELIIGKNKEWRMNNEECRRIKIPFRIKKNGEGLRRMEKNEEEWRNLHSFPFVDWSMKNEEVRMESEEWKMKNEE